MGYKEAMEAAGAKVLAFEQFGSYQGEWFAKLEYEGKTGWVFGSYGSCSGCDAFEAEFCYRNEETPGKLAEFGKEYLEEIHTREEALEQACRHLSWDHDAEGMVKFIFDNEAGISPGPIIKKFSDEKKLSDRELERVTKELKDMEKKARDAQTRVAQLGLSYGKLLKQVEGPNGEKS